MIKFLAAITITGATLITGAQIAHADAVVPLPDGTCAQPASNPPIHVPCDSPAATTPYVKHPMGLANPEDATHVARLGDGSCVRDRLAVPEQVPCPSASATAHRPAAPKAVTARHPRRVTVTDPASFSFAYWVGA